MTYSRRFIRIARAGRTGILPATTAAIVALFPASASAQDRDEWSGFYAGVQGGGSRSELTVAATDQLNQLTNIDPPGAQSFSVVPGRTLTLEAAGRETSTTFGGFAGFQFQANQVVYGIEADVRTGGASVTAQSTQQIPVTLLSPISSVTLGREGESDFEWSVRARFGYAAGKTLIYATGGVGGTNATIDAVNTFTIPAGTAGSPAQAFPAQGPFLVSASQSEGLIGWTAGAGVERRISRHVTLGIEGRYTDYGSKTLNFPNAVQSNLGTAAAAPFTAAFGEGAYPGVTRIELKAAQLTVRLSYSF